MFPINKDSIFTCIAESDINLADPHYWVYDNPSILINGTKRLSYMFGEELDAGDFSKIMSALEPQYWQSYVNPNLKIQPNYESSLGVGSDEHSDLSTFPEFILYLEKLECGYNAFGILFNSGVMLTDEGAGQPFSSEPHIFNHKIFSAYDGAQFLSTGSAPQKLKSGNLTESDAEDFNKKSESITIEGIEKEWTAGFLQFMKYKSLFDIAVEYQLCISGRDYLLEYYDSYMEWNPENWEVNEKEATEFYKETLGSIKDLVIEKMLDGLSNQVQ